MVDAGAPFAVTATTPALSQAIARPRETAVNQAVHCWTASPNVIGVVDRGFCGWFHCFLLLAARENLLHQHALASLHQVGLASCPVQSSHCLLFLFNQQMYVPADVPKYLSIFIQYLFLPQTMHTAHTNGHPYQTHHLTDNHTHTHTQQSSTTIVDLLTRSTSL